MRPVVGFCRPFCLVEHVMDERWCINYYVWHGLLNFSQGGDASSDLNCWCKPTPSWWWPICQTKKKNGYKSPFCWNQIALSNLTKWGMHQKTCNRQSQAKRSHVQVNHTCTHNFTWFGHRAYATKEEHPLTSVTCLYCSSWEWGTLHLFIGSIISGLEKESKSI